MFKVSLEKALPELFTLFSDILKEQKVPDDWKRSLIVNMPKKGHLNIQRRLTIPGTAFYALQAAWSSSSLASI